MKGIVQTQGFERYNTRLNVDANLTDRFKAGLSFNGFIGDRDIEGHDQRDLLRAYSVNPIYHTAESIAFVQGLDQQAQALGLSGFDSGYRGGSSPFNSSIYSLEPGMTAQDWHYGRSGNGIGGSGDAGPATKLDNTDRFEKTFFGNINSYLQYEIADGLNIRTVLGGDMRDTREYFWRGLEFDSRGRTTQTRLQESNVKRTSVLSETTINYATVLGGRHDISAVAGLEFQNFYIKGIALSGTNVPFGQPENFALLNPADVSISERDETIARRSVFGRVNYAFDNRYLLSLSLRRDGDSRFGANNRFEVFPAVSAGWNVHNEAFYNSEFLTDMKLRFSYGSLGTTSFLGAYNSLSLLNPQATIFGNGFLIPSDVANPDLTWQTNTESNIGLNLGFLENRFRFAVDYYTSDVEDILINQSVSEVLGTTSIALNSGDVRSSGLELELGAALINTGDFRWDLSANLSTVQTEITDLGGLDELAPTIYGQSGRGPVFRNYVGGEIGEMWGIQTTGLVEMEHLNNPIEVVGQESGYSYAVDQNGDGVIDRTRTVAEGGDLVKIGQNTPDFYYGFSSQFSFRDFDASFQFQGASGGDVYNIDPLYYGSQWGRSLQSSFDAEGDGIADATRQPYIRNRDQTDAMIQSASYLALRNMTIGYTFRPNLAGDRQPSVRVYAAASNLLYLVGDDYTSFNPEGVETTNGGYLGPTTYGVQVGASPIVRSFSLGLNVNF
jgi:TonB-linked SusC/RagA family outer membrane protein